MSIAAAVDDLMAREEWQRALDLLGQHLDLVEGEAALAWSAGWASYKLGQLEEAVRLLRLASGLAPSDFATTLALGVALRDAGYHGEAEGVLLGALRIRDSHLARVALGLLYLEGGRYADAEAIHREGVRRQPTHRERLESLAHILYDIGRREEAEQLYADASVLPTREERRAGP